jgi:prolipoprotein diacylglyceryltransferase
MMGYTLRLGSGIGVSLSWLWLAARKFHMERSNLIKWVWILSFVAIASGRLAYVFINAEYFRQNPLHIFKLRTIGGLHGESALLGGLLGLGFLVLLNKKTILEVAKELNNRGTPSHSLAFSLLLTLFTPAILSVVAGAWWSCIKVGCAFGRTVNVSNVRPQWFLIYGPDIYQTYQLRYPVQLLGLLWASITAVFSVIWSGHMYSGPLALLLYCLGGMLFSLLRGDITPSIGPIRIDTIECTVIAILMGWILRRCHWRRH